MPQTFGCLGAKPLNDLLCRYSAFAQRLELNEHAGGILAGVASGGAGESDDARYGRIGQYDLREFILDLLHRRKGNVLAGFRLPEDETGILFREKSLGNVDIEGAGSNDQDEGGDRHRKLMPEYPSE